MEIRQSGLKLFAIDQTNVPRLGRTLPNVVV